MKMCKIFFQVSKAKVIFIPDLYNFQGYLSVLVLRVGIT